MFLRLATAGAVVAVVTVTGGGVGAASSAAPTTVATAVAAASTTTSASTTTTSAAPTTSTRPTSPTTFVRRASAVHQQAHAAVQLAGLLSLAPGVCATSVTGTYFRMLQPGGRPGGPASGYLVNADSPCADKTYTPLTPGTDGGLTLGAYQPEPQPAFDAHGNALASRIVQPASFFGVRFSLATAPVDPQTKLSVPAPTLTIDGATIGGDVRALGASWNGGQFNQGSPKPDGTTPGLTARPSGTYDAATGAVVVTWTSAIVGGPFDGFTGEWHLAGRLASGSPATTAVTVTAGAVASASTVASDPSLAETGGRSGSTAVVGMLLVAVGATAGLLAGQRRRSSRTS